MADAGKIGFTIEGDYDNEKAYERNSIVNTDVGTYISKKNTQGNNPDEDENEEFWQPIKSKVRTDSALSKTSLNPVQNKVITNELEKKIEASDIDAELSDTSENAVQNKAVAAAVGSLNDDIQEIADSIGDVSELPEGTDLVDAITTAYDHIGDMDKLPEGSEDITGAIESLNGAIVGITDGVPGDDYLNPEKSYKNNDVFIYKNKTYKIRDADNGVTGAAVLANFEKYSTPTTFSDEFQEREAELTAKLSTLDNDYTLSGFVQGAYVGNIGSAYTTNTSTTRIRASIVKTKGGEISFSTPSGYGFAIMSIDSNNIIVNDFDWASGEFTKNISKNADRLLITVRKNDNSSITPSDVANINFYVKNNAIGAVVSQMAQELPQELAIIKSLSEYSVQFGYGGTNDCDNQPWNTIYEYQQNTPHAPISSAFTTILSMRIAANNRFGFQLAVVGGQEKLFIRSCWSGYWSSWKSVSFT